MFRTAASTRWVSRVVRQKERIPFLITSKKSWKIKIKHFNTVNVAYQWKIYLHDYTSRRWDFQMYFTDFVTDTYGLANENKANHYQASFRKHRKKVKKKSLSNYLLQVYLKWLFFFFSCLILDAVKFSFVTWWGYSMGIQTLPASIRHTLISVFKKFIQGSNCIL